MESWQKVLAVGAGAVGVAGLLCYVLNDDEVADGAADAASTVATAGSAISSSKQDFIDLLKEIVETKTASETKLKEISKKLVAHPEGLEKLVFDDLYALVKDGGVEVTDPLEKRGLAPEAIDDGIQKWGEADPEIQGLIYKIMAPDASAGPPPKDVSLDELAELHQYMATETEAFIGVYKEAADSDKEYDSKTVLMAFQVSLDAKVLKKFGIGSQDVQQSIMAKQSQLQTNPKFIKAFQEFQAHMNIFMEILPQGPRSKR